jgi:hypothetical protein
MVLAAACGTMATVVPAHAGNGSTGCGLVVTVNTTLDHDIGPCNSGPSGSAVTIGADNITLNLNGHSVFGNAGTPGDGVGIGMTGRTGVKVLGPGTVRDFDAGVAISGGGNNQVVSVSALNNVGDNSTDFGDGIALNNTHDNIIRGNIAQGNGPYDGIGVVGPTSFGNQILYNAAINNLTAPGDHGIRFEPGTHHNTATGNNVAGNFDGILVFNNSTDNVLTNNSSNRNQRDGIAVAGSGARRNQVVGNSANANGRYGFATSGQSNTFAGNSARGNATFDAFDSNANCDNNTWVRNFFGTVSQACIH